MKSRAKTISLCSFLLVVIALSLWRFVSAMQVIRAEQTRPPNILIVSTCSLRVQMLKLYGMTGDKEIMPNLEKFFRESDYVFTNAMNGIGWTALSAFTKIEVPRTKLMNLGYRLPGHSESNYMYRVPHRKSRKTELREAHIDDSDFEKDIAGTLYQLEETIMKRANAPFLMTAHIKYMHYPLIDRFNPSAEWAKYLNKDEKAKIDGYLAKPGTFHSKLPLMLLLSNNPRLALKHPKIKPLKWKTDAESLKQLSGLITNPEFVAEWKSSAGFEQDLEILRKVYRANAEYLDTLLGPILNLYGDKYLQDNTIVIFSGDHGEVHMERDELTHGLSLFEESMRVPLAIRFPEKFGHNERKVINEAFHYGNFARAILQVIEGRNTSEEFPDILNEVREDVIIGRDCKNSVRGLRYQNKYKYFVNVASGERFLFDLEKDPSESENIAQTNPKEADRMETLYWETLPKFTQYETYYCAPWNL